MSALCHVRVKQPSNGQHGHLSLSWAVLSGAFWRSFDRTPGAVTTGPGRAPRLYSSSNHASQRHGK